LRNSIACPVSHADLEVLEAGDALQFPDHPPADRVAGEGAELGVARVELDEDLTGHGVEGRIPLHRHSGAGQGL
jgi:hypothetical protein